jgi:hypothetical protein
LQIGEHLPGLEGVGGAGRILDADIRCLQGLADVVDGAAQLVRQHQGGAVVRGYSTDMPEGAE